MHDTSLTPWEQIRSEDPDKSGPPLCSQTSCEGGRHEGSLHSHPPIGATDSDLWSQPANAAPASTAHLHSVVGDTIALTPDGRSTKLICPLRNETKDNMWVTFRGTLSPRLIRLAAHGFSFVTMWSEQRTRALSLPPTLRVFPPVFMDHDTITASITTALDGCSLVKMGRHDKDGIVNRGAGLARSGILARALLTSFGRKFSHCYALLLGLFLFPVPGFRFRLRLLWLSKNSGAVASGTRAQTYETASQLT